MPDREAYDDRIMAYLRADIAANGGTGRRLSKIAYELGVFEDREKREFGQAIERLRFAGKIQVEDISAFGFIYAIPVEADHAG